MFWKQLLNWILSRATLRIYSSPTPIGKRLGGFDIPNVVDSYIVIDITISGRQVFLGYWQSS